MVLGEPLRAKGLLLRKYHGAEGFGYPAKDRSQRAAVVLFVIAAMTAVLSGAYGSFHH